MIQIGRSNSGMHPHAAPAVAKKGQHSEGYCSDMGAVPHHYTPTPETEPGAIAADQRAALLELLPPVVIDPAAMSVAVVPLSVAVVLPVWTVTQRLRELGYVAAAPAAPAPAAAPKPNRGPARERNCWADVLAAVATHLRSAGPLSTTQLAAHFAVSPSHLGQHLRRTASRFYVARLDRPVGCGRGGDVQVWWLVGVPVPGAKRVRRTG